MLQRIQSLYLVAAAALVAVSLFVPLAWFGGAAGEFSLGAFALTTADGKTVHSTLYLGLLLAAACALAVVTLFLFRRRLLQIRLCAVQAVLLGGGVVMECIYYFLSRRVFADLEVLARSIRPAAVLPLVALCFVLLAARAIFRDELLVRAADRIR